MIKKDIIEIANEVWEIDSFPSPAVLKLIKFAELVAAHEREECAKIADNNRHNVEMLTSLPLQSGAARCIASAIRARGQK